MEANRDLPLAKALDTHVFKDEAGLMGQAALDLGNAHLKTNVTIGNNSVYYALLLNSVQGSPSRGQLKKMTVESADAAKKSIDDAIGRMEKSKMTRSDAATVLAEFETNADLARFALELGKARIQSGDVGTAQLPKDKRSAAAAQLEKIITRYRELWLTRNRPGGLSDSVGRMESLLKALRS
jgi:hypothetical protein